MAVPRSDNSGDLIPAGARAEVENVMNGYSLGRIEQFFAVEGFALPPGYEVPPSAMRRSTVRAFHSTIDFGSAEDARAYLRVVDRLLDELSDTYRTRNEAWPSEAMDRLLREFRRADIEPGPDQDGALALPARITVSASLASAPTESGIRLAIPRLERSHAEPEERIGAAKELVEATIKYALGQLAEAHDANEDIPALARQLHKRLRLDPKAIAPTTKGADTITRILGGLTNIPQGLAELRNAGYGTGHGQATRISGIKPRHADLAVRTAVAYAGFVLDTVNDPDAPWR